MIGKLISQAKKNYRDYRIIEKFIAGLVLTGSEIKSLHNHQTSISEAYILPYQQELYIINMHISAYKYTHASDLAQAHNTTRKRKLLLNRKEINKIIRQLKMKNYVLIPLQLFFSNKGWAKLEIAVAQRLRKYQIKEKIKDKKMKRKMRNDEDI